MLCSRYRTVATPDRVWTESGRSHPRRGWQYHGPVGTSPDAAPVVVVIDDDDDDRFLFRRMLKRAAPNAVLHEYEAADLALDDFVDPARFDASFGGARPLVVLDINMPRMSGFEFLERVAELRRTQIRVVVVSASDNPDDQARARSFAVVEAVHAKPLSTALLRELCSA